MWSSEVTPDTPHTACPRLESRLGHTHPVSDEVRAALKFPKCPPEKNSNSHNQGVWETQGEPDWVAPDCAQGKAGLQDDQGTRLSLWLAALGPLCWWEAGGKSLEAHPMDKPAESDRKKMLGSGPDSVTLNASEFTQPGDRLEDETTVLRRKSQHRRVTWGGFRGQVMLDGGGEGKGSRMYRSTWVGAGPAPTLQWGVAPEHLFTWRTRAGQGDVKMWSGAHLPRGSGLTRPARGQRVYKSMQNHPLEVSLRKLNCALELAFEQTCISPSHPHTTIRIPQSIMFSLPVGLKNAWLSLSLRL